MKKPRLRFAATQIDDVYYDLFDDYELIEASFAQQYGIRLRYEDNMPWSEFATLLAGLNDKTPLGRVVSIRAENNPDILKHFTPEMNRIRREWRARACKKQIIDNDTYEREMQAIVNAFRGLK